MEFFVSFGLLMFGIACIIQNAQSQGQMYWLIYVAVASFVGMGLLAFWGIIRRLRRR